MSTTAVHENAGRWFSPFEQDVLTAGYAECPDTGEVSVFSFGWQTAGGEIVRPFVSIEASPDHPLTPDEVRELREVLAGALLALGIEA